MDDVLVISQTVQEQVFFLDILFQQLQNYDFVLRPSKCKFASYEYNLLGHLVTPMGITLDPQKIQAIERITDPEKREKLQSILGLLAYHQGFVYNYSGLYSNNITSLLPPQTN